MKILVINGPNLNFLGIREKNLYGAQTYADLEAFIREKAAALNLEIELFQSNHEGAIVDKIQSAYGVMDGIVINPAAYTHTSVAILDALKAVSLPAAEVHLTDISKREPFRQVSLLTGVCAHSIIGKGTQAYEEAVKYLISAAR